MEWKRILDRELTRFNKLSGGPSLNLSGSWQAFLLKMTAYPKHRTIISATYVFLLEFEDHRQELQLREGSSGGSNQPFTVHLFTGGLLFESLLKYCYPKNDRGEDIRTLEGVFGTTQFLTDFSLLTMPPIKEFSLEKIHAAISDNSMVTAFTTAGKLRNTTGHNLGWDDVFDTPQKYVDLFQQLVNAILYVLSRKLM